MAVELLALLHDGFGRSGALHGRVLVVEGADAFELLLVHLLWSCELGQSATRLGILPGAFGGCGLMIIVVGSRAT